MNKLHGRASNEVSHLATRRISGNPPEKDWHITQILGEIETVARDFAAKASDKKLHSKIREPLKQPSKEMLVWIGNNVTHSNVASCMIVSTFPSVSVSWAMMIFTMLLACSTMENVYFSDYEDRLKLDDTLMEMRRECDRFKEHVRRMLMARYKIEPPGGIHPAPKPILYRL